MELKLLIAEGTQVTIGDIRRIISAIEKAGYEVEALPTEIQPRIIKITTEG